MLCVTIIIIIGGWDAHFHVSLSGVFPFVCLRPCLCVRIRRCNIVACIFSSLAAPLLSLLLSAIAVAPDGWWCCRCDFHSLFAAYRRMWCCMRLTHPNVNSHSHWPFVIISSARYLLWCHLYCSHARQTGEKWENKSNLPFQFIESDRVCVETLEINTEWKLIANRRMPFNLSRIPKLLSYCKNYEISLLGISPSMIQS